VDTNVAETSANEQVLPSWLGPPVHLKANLCGLYKLLKKHAEGHLPAHRPFTYPDRTCYPVAPTNTDPVWNKVFWKPRFLKYYSIL
jgi:hypothetical protein